MNHITKKFIEDCLNRFVIKYFNMWKEIIYNFSLLFDELTTLLFAILLAVYIILTAFTDILKEIINTIIRPWSLLVLMKFILEELLKKEHRIKKENDHTDNHHKEDKD